MTALVATVWCSAVPVASASPSLTVRSLETSAYPTVVVDVGVPAELGASDTAIPDFEVMENGSKRTVASVEARTQKTEFEVVLVIDTSGSMAGVPLSHARDAAVRFIDTLPQGTPVAIVAFGSRPTVMSGFTTSSLALSRIIEDLVASGETAVYDALRTAAGLKPSATGLGNRTIVLLSDGGDTSSVTTLNEAVRTVRSAKAPVLAVSIASPEQDQRALDILATRSGGRMVPVTDSADLGDYFASLATEIAGGYRVRFLSARPNTKDLELDITASLGGRTASAYSSVPNPLFVTRAEFAGTGIKVEKANPIQLFGAALLAFMAVALVGGLGAASILRAPTRLDDLRYYDQLRAEQNSAGGRGDTIAAKLVEAVDSVAGRHGFVGVLAPRLARAGMALRPAEWIIFHLLGVVIAGFMAEWLLDNRLISFLVVVLATAVPLLMLDVRGNKRLRAFENQLPDVLNLLSGGLRTGWGIQQSLELVTAESMPPASEEFKRVQLEARLGVPIERALGSLAERLGSRSFEWVVSAIAIQREVGGNLAEVLDQVAASIRDRESMTRQIASLSAEGRISAVILIVLPFVIVAGLLVISPDYILGAFASPAFLLLLAVGVVLMAVGALWLRAIARIEY